MICPPFSKRAGRTWRGHNVASRTRALVGRGIDFEDAIEVFAGGVFEQEDRRQDYGEVRIVTIGQLRGRMVVVVWTRRGDARHVISMRKANEREQARFGQRLGKA